MTLEIPLARRDLIANRLADGEPVVAATLAAEFAISEDAIRRDLRALASLGLCRRVYGGALPITPRTQPMAARIDRARNRKEALARKAVEGIRPGELLFLDCGSTNLALVECLPEDQELTVVTNSIDIAAAVLRRSDLRLIMIGGSVDPTVGGCIDAAAVLAVQQMNFDRCFLGACSVGLKAGIGAIVHADAHFKRAAAAASQHCIVLALAEKFSTKVPHRVCALSDIDLLVVEHDESTKVLDPLRSAGPKITRAARPV